MVAEHIKYMNKYGKAVWKYSNYKQVGQTSVASPLSRQSLWNITDFGLVRGLSLGLIQTGA